MVSIWRILTWAVFGGFVQGTGALGSPNLSKPSVKVSMHKGSLMNWRIKMKMSVISTKLNWWSLFLEGKYQKQVLTNTSTVKDLSVNLCEEFQHQKGAIFLETIDYDYDYGIVAEHNAEVQGLVVAIQYSRRQSLCVTSASISSVARKLPSGQQLVNGTVLPFKETTIVTRAKVKVGNIAPSQMRSHLQPKGSRQQVPLQEMRSNLMQTSSLNHPGANKTGL